MEWIIGTEHGRVVIITSRSPVMVLEVMTVSKVFTANVRLIQPSANYFPPNESQGPSTPLRPSLLCLGHKETISKIWEMINNVK